VPLPTSRPPEAAENAGSQAPETTKLKPGVKPEPKAEPKPKTKARTRKRHTAAGLFSWFR
jgi:hypothetical protein